MVEGPRGRAGARDGAPQPWPFVWVATDLVFVAMLATVTVTDLRRRLIPNRVLVAAVAIGMPPLALADAGSLLLHLAAAAAAGGFFLILAVARPGGLGMGDVKLIAAMGLFLGQAVLGAVLVALLAGSLFGLALVLRHGRVAVKWAIPFGPFLAVGGLVAMLGGVPLLQ
jgi:leader peptidase (prepilin peptidase) / N-methyltransferase